MALLIGIELYMIWIYRDSCSSHYIDQYWIEIDEAISIDHGHILIYIYI